VPADREPPHDEVLAALVVSLRAELARALERIAELEARLAQSPRNSSRPPRSTGPARRPPPARTRAPGDDTHPPGLNFVHSLLGPAVTERRAASAHARFALAQSRSILRVKIAFS
jgi:hypothetical protein